MKKIFIDASGWIAVMHRGDNCFQIAKDIFEREIKAKSVFVLSNWTFYEALTILKAKVGFDAAKRLSDVVEGSSFVFPVKVDENLESKAVELFWRYKDKDWGVVDCSSIVIIKEYGCDFVFAFDTHFVQASRQCGFSLLANM